MWQVFAHDGAFLKAVLLGEEKQHAGGYTGRWSLLIFHTSCVYLVIIRIKSIIFPLG